LSFPNVWPSPAYFLHVHFADVQASFGFEEASIGFASLAFIVKPMVLAVFSNTLCGESAVHVARGVIEAMQRSGLLHECKETPGKHLEAGSYRMAASARSSCRNTYVRHLPAFQYANYRHCYERVHTLNLIYCSI
jgi:hypothetical protein